MPELEEANHSLNDSLQPSTSQFDDNVEMRSKCCWGIDAFGGRLRPQASIAATWPLFIRKSSQAVMR